MTLLAVLGATVVLLAGCSEEQTGAVKRIAMPEPVSEQGEHTLALWQGAWIAALLVGLLVWGLTIFVIVRFRRRSDDEVPVQTRYNLPLEIFYTIAPVLMVVVFFKATVTTQNAVLEKVEPDVVVDVTGQQWSWTFNYNVDEDGDGEAERYLNTVGTGNDIPTLYLPVDEVAEFRLHSPDVVHNFGVPGFIMRMDVIPGRVNSYQITPTEIGEYAGKCYELCGAYHSRMLFTVAVVSRADYEAHLAELEEAGQVTEDPLIGGESADTQVGAPESDNPEGEGK
ncbi:cytochrome c oxidase subunit II [Nocardioides ferulae]|uniref:aa3-type cytochrome oxidase subunit II n=1 Tax=Nocardioides ferulae TaxID=2340821 RepID=UPI000EB351BE|nr:cytochrome c oxidase subunit II [Nocardioides ferulae]